MDKQEIYKKLDNLQGEVERLRESIEESEQEEPEITKIELGKGFSVDCEGFDENSSCKWILTYKKDNKAVVNTWCSEIDDFMDEVLGDWQEHGEPVGECFYLAKDTDGDFSYYVDEPVLNEVGCWGHEGGNYGPDIMGYLADHLKPGTKYKIIEA